MSKKKLLIIKLVVSGKIFNQYVYKINLLKKKMVKKTLKKTRKKEIPISIKVISILFYVVAALSLLYGVILVGVGVLGNNYIENVSEEEILNSIRELSPEAVPELENLNIEDVRAGLKLLIIFGSLFGIISGLLLFIIGKNLWKGKRWAWITSIVFLTLILLKHFVEVFQGKSLSIAWTAIIVVILYFLAFDVKSKTYFK